MSKYTLINGDCFTELQKIPDKSINLVLIDPPYNVGVVTQKGGVKTKNKWDTISNYDRFCTDFLRESHRVLADNGVLYLWHSEIPTISKIILEAEKIGFAFVSFCIWDKGDGYRAQSWHNREPDGKTALRSWFNVCEYCIHFYKVSKSANAWERHTGTERINSDPTCYKELKDWCASELKRLSLTPKQIGEKYTEVTGKKPFMLRHYFCDYQFAIPTPKIWETVYMPLGFSRSCEDLRQSYEDLRHYHRCDPMHCNVWRVPPIPSQNRLHTCQKPVEILRRIIRTSCPPSGTVLDFFMGSGSTGVAAVKEERDFIGIELDPQYFEAAKKRIEYAEKEPEQITLEIPPERRRKH